MLAKWMPKDLLLYNYVTQNDVFGAAEKNKSKQYHSVPL